MDVQWIANKTVSIWGTGLMSEQAVVRLRTYADIVCIYETDSSK